MPENSRGDITEILQYLLKQNIGLRLGLASLKVMEAIENYADAQKNKTVNELLKKRRLQLNKMYLLYEEKRERLFRLPPPYITELESTEPVSAGALLKPFFKHNAVYFGRNRCNTFYYLLSFLSTYSQYVSKEDRYHILLALYQTELFTDENVDNVLNSKRGETRGLMVLGKRQVLTQEKIDILHRFYQDFPEDLMYFHSLREDNTTEEIEQFISVHKNYIHRNVAGCLRQAGLLLAGNTVALVHPDNSFLRSDAAFQKVWGLIPRHLLTQENFAAIIARARESKSLDGVHQFVMTLIDRRAVAQQAPRPRLNGQQSTHTASVHKSTSDSALRLKQRYGKQINRSDKLAAMLNRITHYVLRLPNHDFINRCAKKFISKLSSFGGSVDPMSGCSLSQYLALGFIALHDGTVRTATLEDGLRCFVLALYEMQRAYNLDYAEDGQDFGPRDGQSCFSGCLNKLTEKLLTIHPDIELLIITPAQAAIKLPRLARETAAKFLLSEIKASDPETFQDIVTRIESDQSFEVIWSSIDDEIREQLFDEFKSVYNNDRNHVKFNELIQYGMNISEEDMRTFLQQVGTLTPQAVNSASLFASADSGDEEHKDEDLYPSR